MIEEIKKEIRNRTEFYDYEDKVFRNINRCNSPTKEYISTERLFEILDKYNKKSIYEKIIIQIQWYLNHLNNTKIVYDQKEISSYIDNMIIKFSLEGNSISDYSGESERIQYILKHWSHLQLARDYVELEEKYNLENNIQAGFDQDLLNESIEAIIGNEEEE